VFRGEIAAREHQALLESALNRDWKKAQAIMVSHIRGCVDHALREDHAGIFSGSSPAAATRPAAKVDGANAKSKGKPKAASTKRVSSK
jgi:hypothetical protein